LVLVLQAVRIAAPIRLNRTRIKAALRRATPDRMTVNGISSSD
jgi:hypothetical protein